MAVLYIASIRCIETEDFGPDEPYLVVNGKTVWGPKEMDERESRAVSRFVLFGRRARVVLYDADWPDSDDFIDDEVLRSTSSPMQTYVFAGSGARYEVDMAVVDDHTMLTTCVYGTPDRVKATDAVDRDVAIEVANLDKLITDPDTPTAFVASLVSIDPDRTRAFRPRYQFTAAIGRRRQSKRLDATALMFQRNSAIMERRKRKRYASTARILAEGDSWFDLPEDCPDIPDDVPEILLRRGYAVTSIAAHGEELAEILHDGDHWAELQKGYDIFLLSAGGNDLLGDGMTLYLKAYDPRLRPEQYLNRAGELQLRHIQRTLDEFFAELQARYPELLTVFHGYDYPRPGIPNKYLGGAVFIAEPLANELHITDRDLQAAITRNLVDRLNDVMQCVAQKYPGSVAFLRNCGCIPDEHWWDEIHPKTKGYKKITKRFQKIIDAWTPP